MEFVFKKKPKQQNLQSAVTHLPEGTGKRLIRKVEKNNVLQVHRYFHTYMNTK